MDLPQRDDYQNILLNDTPLLDVRAPVEFKQGAFPRASNIPLINDDERRDIGIQYKNKGQAKAIELGHELVSGKTREDRIAHWIEFTQKNPEGVLYCFRGGMRSRITQQWIYENTGITFPRVKGGYKSMRRYLLDGLENAARNVNALVLSGSTGVGKTQLLQFLDATIDLEKIFHHRGSAFGHHPTPQPGQIDIENNLAIRILKLQTRGLNTLIFEDECSSIGSRRVPDCLAHTLKQSSIVLLEAPLAERIETIYQEYIIQALQEYQLELGELAGFEAWANNLLSSLERIQRRLGGQHYKSIRSVMDYAIINHRNSAHLDDHKAWIHDLLVNYYDPMYDYQLSKKSERIIFRGDRQAVMQFLKSSTINIEQ